MTRKPGTEPPLSLANIPGQLDLFDGHELTEDECRSERERIYAANAPKRIKAALAAQRRADRKAAALVISKLPPDKR